MNLSLSDLSLISDSLRQSALASLRKSEDAAKNHRPHLHRINRRDYNASVSLMGRIMVEIERETQIQTQALTQTQIPK